MLEHLDLNALIEDCLSIFRAKAEQQNVELISFIQPQVPRVISGDPTRLRQALLSLLENALNRCRSVPAAPEICLGHSLERVADMAPC